MNIHTISVRRAFGAIGERTLIACCLLSVCALAHADTTWDGSESADWFDADNWSAGVPDVGDIAYIPGVSPFPDITGSGNDAEAQRVLVGYNSSAILDITDGATLTTTQGDSQPSYLSYNALGYVDLDGAGSRWDILGLTQSTATAIRIGYNAGTVSRGRIKLENGAYVSIASDAGIRLWSWDLGSGSYQRSQVLIGSNSEAGILDAGWLEGDAGSTADSELRFNHTSSDFYFTSDGTATGDAVDVLGEITVYQTGSGTTHLTGANTYTGGTSISDGTLAVSGNGNLGDNSSGIAFILGTSTGTLRATSSFTNEHAIDLSATAGAIEVDSGELLSQNAAISGDEALAKTGTGALELLVDCPSYTGAVTVEEGTLIQRGTLGASSITVDAGTLYSNHQQGTFSASVAVPYDFSGEGEIRFDGYNNLTGDCSGFSGKLRTDLTVRLGDGTQNWGSWDVDIQITGGVNQRALFDQVGEFEITGNITGNGGLSLGSGDIIRLSGNNNTYTGPTYLSGDGSELILSGNMGNTQFSSQVNVGDTAAITIDTDGEITIQSNLQAGTNVSFTKIGSGTAILSGTNAIRHFVISEGTIQIADGGDLGNYTVTNNSAIIFDVTGTGTASETIGGTGTLTKNNTGTAVLTGANTYTGATTVNGGTLQIGNGASAAGTLGTGVVNLGGSGTLAYHFDGTGGTRTISNTLSGAGSVNTLGANTFAFTGVDAFAGTVNIGGTSTVSLENLAGDLVTDTGTFDPAPAAATSATVGGDYTLESGGTLKIEIGGTAQGTEYDVLNVTGTATLGGTIEVTFIDGYTISGDGVSFNILNYGTLVDNGVTLSLPNVLDYYVQETVWSDTGLTISYYADNVSGFRAKYGLNSDGSDDWLDWSNNGVANVLYYLFGLGDPNQVSVPYLTYDGDTPTPGMPVLTDHGDGTFTYSYTWPSADVSFDDTCQSSTDLTTWYDAFDAMATVPATDYFDEYADGGYEIRHTDFDLSGGGTAVFRLDVQSE